MSRESDGLTTKIITKFNHKVIYYYSVQLKQVDFSNGLFFMCFFIIIIFIFILVYFNFKVFKLFSFSFVSI